MKNYTKIALMTFATLTLLGSSIQKNVHVKAYGSEETTPVLKDETTFLHKNALNAKQVTYRAVNYYIPQFKEIYEKLGNYECLYHSYSEVVGEPVDLPFFHFDENAWVKLGYPLVGRFDGWYTDDTFTTPFVKGTLLEEGEDALKLYGLFDYSTDYTFYLNDSGSIFGNKPYIYFKCQYDDQEKTAWPGEALTKNENGYYEIPIDVSYGYDLIVINDGTADQATAIQSVLFDANTVLDQDVILVGTQNENKTYNLIAPEYATINYYDGKKLLGKRKVLKNNLFQPTFFEKEGYRLIGWYLDPTFETLYTGGTAEDSLNLYAKYEEAEDFEIYVTFNDSRWVENGIAIHRWSSKFDNPNATDIDNVPVDTIKITDYFYKFTIDASKSYDRMQIKIANTFTKIIYLDDYISGTYYPNSQSGELFDCSFFPKTIQAHIKGETLKLPAHNATAEGVPYLGFDVEATATETGVSILTLETDTITFKTEGITEEQRKNAVITYFKNREAGYWCDKSANYLEYQILASGYENEIIDEENETTIGDRVNYLAAMAQKAKLESQSAKFNSANITNNNVSFVILVVALGFISIIGYYFFNKRKLEI